MKAKVKLELNKKSVPELIAFATHVVTSVTGNNFFPAPYPALSALTTATNNLATAYNNAQGAGPGQTAILHEKRDALELLLTQLGMHVEVIANEPVNAATGAEVIILSAGMAVKTATPHHKQVFDAEQGNTSGSVHLVAGSIVRGSHDWQYVPEPVATNGWKDAPSTTKASATINGLQAGSRYSFRHRSVTTDGEGDWDGPLSLMVV